MIPPNEYDSGKVLLFNKPKNWTSFDVVNKVKYLTKAKKVGHAGTLDPLATGLLIICTGKMTKQIEQFQQMPKEYTGTFFIGATTPSFDLETEVDQTYKTNHITKELIQFQKASFMGDIMQSPPLHSAIKINGQRAYRKARKGSDMELQPREVTVYEFEITRVELPEIDFRIACSKGTYIRAIARDFAKALNSGGYLKELCRTKIGDHNLADSWNLDSFTEMIKNEQKKSVFDSK